MKTPWHEQHPPWMKLWDLWWASPSHEEFEADEHAIGPWLLYQANRHGRREDGSGRVVGASGEPVSLRKIARRFNMPEERVERAIARMVAVGTFARDEEGLFVPGLQRWQDSPEARRTRKWRKNLADGGPGEVVYFGVRDRDRRIKIGWTTNLAVREMDHKNSFKGYRTVGCIPGGRKKEKELHDRFAVERVGNSEWFDPSEKLVSFLEDTLGDALRDALGDALRDSFGDHQKSEVRSQKIRGSEDEKIRARASARGASSPPDLTQARLMWADLCPSLPPAGKADPAAVGDQRLVHKLEALKSTLAERGVTLAGYFERIAASGFLQRKQPRTSFEWALTHRNAEKVLAGDYAKDFEADPKKDAQAAWAAVTAQFRKPPGERSPPSDRRAREALERVGGYGAVGRADPYEAARLRAVFIDAFMSAEAQHARAPPRAVADLVRDIAKGKQVE